MLSGKFVNCYGLQNFELAKMDFEHCNKAIIYAPNGVMKTSLSKVFEDISKGQPTSDRIFKDMQTSYTVNYYSTTFTSKELNATEHIYVINSFSDKLELSKETLSTLLADENTRREYDIVASKFQVEIKEFEFNMASLTGLTKPSVKVNLLRDLSLPIASDWTDIFEKLNELVQGYAPLSCLDGIKYSDIFNAKAAEVYNKQIFKKSVNEYMEKLNTLVKDNAILSTEFNDYNAEELSKALAKHNLFNAKHSIHLKDGETIITDIDTWKHHVDTQLAQIYKEPELCKVFNELKKTLTKNVEALRLRDVIIENRAIIPLLNNPKSLCIKLWLYYMSQLDKDFHSYVEKITTFSEEIKGLYKKAAIQNDIWKCVVDCFNQRFKVPFEVKIADKANFLLKDVAPSVYFTYTVDGGTENEKKADCSKDDLMSILSMGERKAMYLLYTIFDLERIKKQATQDDEKFLIIVDDIADSFDYKNKYAIIEYLSDLSLNTNIDIVILSHNFDFYRTLMTRLDVRRENCYIVQKDNGILNMSQFIYRNDFFKKVIVESIKDGQLNSDKKKKCLISSIPFYRNLCEYMLKPEDYLKLTCFLHVKTSPLNLKESMLSHLWEIISPLFGLNVLFTQDELYLDVLRRISKTICHQQIDEVILENKILISVSIRLEAELFLESVLLDNGCKNFESNGQQTRVWSNLAIPYLDNKQKQIIEEVNLMTPESIHLNSFMYEPIIDMSDWALKDLYSRVLLLSSTK